MEQELSEKEARELDYEIEFLEGIVARRPDFLEALVVLGDDYTRRGFYRKGLDVDLRLARLAPEDPVIHYNLACSLSLVGELDRAFEAIERAIALGFRDIDLLEKDSHLDNMRRDSRFAAILEKARRLT